MGVRINLLKHHKPKEMSVQRYAWNSCVFRKNLYLWSAAQICVTVFAPIWKYFFQERY